ncbi:MULTISPECIES: head maturation protease, ClpP-related [Actinomycetaceae]|uniref:ATP-dependent Clp protease proteolytic subunit n=2 Tax=Actinomycetaceae TaxID=2049 RepID=A0A1Q5PZA1_9ACTO|nr:MULTISPECIES: head maturation protease, ClpP-related [Actinomycetaceae]MDU7384038.1 Clp protease ClpP [Schaalia turicensis]OKL52961.1 Clp protease ClpP [Bowdeniella nasicola]QYB16343.1 Clp protease ClpP [Schaalia turicensis]WCE45846.1 Clp protease ClpP [Winkia neuii subsp. anitrata]
MRRFWNWLTPEPRNTDPDAGSVRVLRISGTIAEESWFDDDITPAIFANELNAGSGPVTIWLNSPGGDVVAAAQIYNMLIDYPGTVTVNIDGIAASAASVIAMAATKVAMSPVSMLMIHNPATMAVGDKDELARAMNMLDSVKESILNAYQEKTNLSRAKLSKLMDAETWMDARAAIDMGFADELLTGERNPMFAVSPEKPNDDLDDDEDKVDSPDEPDDDEKRLPFPPKNAGLGTVFSRRAAEQKLVAHLTATSPPKPMRPPHLTTTPAAPLGRRVCDLYAELANQPH